MLEVCNRHSIVIVAFNVLGQGLLTDSCNRERFPQIRASRMLRLSWDRITPLRDALRDAAERHKRTMAQVAIRWTIQKGALPLIGMRNVQHVHDAAGAMGWELDANEMQRLDSVALDCSTLEKPRWKRFLFVFLISLLLFAYWITRWLPRGRPSARK